MSAAFILTCVLVVSIFTTSAEPQMNVVGEGLLSKPFTVNGQPGRGMRYAGPVVYTNEKPPIIFFPPPPKDAKPGFGGLSIFGKNKTPKSIKYVPMPHHDLPVLIYTSDKMPPIHVVQPGNVIKNEGRAPFRPPREEFRPPSGSLSSTYRGILPEASSARIVTSSYEIPSTSYGSPVKAIGSSLGSLDISLTGSSTAEAGVQRPEHSSNLGFGPPPVSQHLPNIQRPFRPGSSKKAPPHILYSGHTPIHFFDEPDMFVQAPKEIPLKTYADMPPKASFGPSKSSFFGPPSINSFGAPHSLHHNRPPPISPYSSPTSFRPSYIIPARENLIPSASSQNPAAIVPSPNNTPNVENNQAPVSPSREAAQSNERPPTHSFNPPQTMFSFGPFSIEYGPPSEPFMSFSEPTGSLTSIYGAMNDGASGSNSINGKSEEGWMPGTGPLSDNAEGQIKEESWDAPMPPPLPSYQPHMRPPSSFHGPRPHPMHSSVLLPSGPSTPFFGGSRLAHLLSAFKLKRSKPKYAVAPKSMHKPPIIIYYGKKPPVHVYQKPDDEEFGSQTSASSTSAVTVTSAESPSSVGSSVSNNGNSGSSKEVVQSTSFENVELTYDGSQKSEVRVAVPRSPISTEGGEGKPAIIPAKPVDIFSSADLQPTIYRARNSLNTILVSDLSGSGANTIKTYIVRSNDESPDSRVSKYSAAQEQDANINSNDNNGGSIPFAQLQDRISSGDVADRIPNVSVPISENEQVEAARGSGDSSNDNMPPTIVLAIGTPKQETEEIQSQASEPAVAVIQSPSSFQTSLSQAEKDAEEAVEASSS